jgi:hypothetical protein
MFGFVDFNMLVLGLIFGLALSTVLVLFLIYAAANTPRIEERPHNWRPISKYESRRSFLHATGHDSDTYEW